MKNSISIHDDIKKEEDEKDEKKTKTDVFFEHTQTRFVVGHDKEEEDRRPSVPGPFFQCPFFGLSYENWNRLSIGSSFFPQPTLISITTTVLVIKKGPYFNI